MNIGGSPSWVLVSTLALPQSMEDGGLESKHYILVTFPTLLPCAQHWARLGVSSANMNPEGILAPSSWLPSQGPAGLTKSLIFLAHSPLRLPILVNRRV